MSTYDAHRPGQSTSADHAVGSETRQIPPPDFEAIAQRVIEAKIFEEGKLRESDYASFPYHVSGGKDVGKENQQDYNRTFREALNILIPPKEFIHFILREISGEIQPEILKAAFTSINRMGIPNPKGEKGPESLAWSTDSVAIRQTNKNREGLAASVVKKSFQVMRDNPDLVVAISLYEALTRTFVELVIEHVLDKKPQLSIREVDIKTVTEQFTGNSNFMLSVVPAVMSMANQNGELDTTGDIDFSQETIQQAVTFVKKAGFYRHDVVVPARIARDGQERIQHLHCPASENLTTVLFAVLGEIYKKVRLSDELKIGIMKHTISRKIQDISQYW